MLSLFRYRHFQKCKPITVAALATEVKGSYCILIFFSLLINTGTGCHPTIHCFCILMVLNLKDFCENYFLRSIRTDRYWVSLQGSLISMSIAGGM
jgi:hypothetical protein